MTPRQKRIIGVLVVTNGVIILGLVLFITRFSGSASSALLPTPVPTYPPGSLSSQECQQRAAEIMSQAGLSGAATVIPGGALQLDLVYRDTAAESLGNAAQQVWEAFDIATALTEDRCAMFSRVEIRINVRSRSDQKLGQIRAAVPATHLKAFHNGSLSESEFIDQVTYEAIPASDQAGNQ
jgi:hypothetical protein